MRLHGLLRGSCGIVAALLWFFLSAVLARAQTQDALVQGAKKEGKVVYWTTMRVTDAQALADAFESRYPFLKVEVVRISGDQLIERAIAESQAGTITADVLDAFSFKILQNRGLIQPYASPEAAARRGDLRPERQISIRLRSFKRSSDWSSH
jgi:ABC-type glycerol-3-phosphate transport system substrate-binding protein